MSQFFTIFNEIQHCYTSLNRVESWRDADQHAVKLRDRIKLSRRNVGDFMDSERWAVCCVAAAGGTSLGSLEVKNLFGPWEKEREKIHYKNNEKRQKFN